MKIVLILQVVYESYSGNAGKSEVTIIRSIKNLGNESNIGVLLTNRDYRIGGHGKLVEVDGNLRIRDKYSIAFDFAKSNTQESHQILSIALTL